MTVSRFDDGDAEDGHRLMSVGRLDDAVARSNTHAVKAAIVVFLGRVSDATGRCA